MIIIIIGPLNQNQVDAETGAIIRTLTVEITREQVSNSDLCCAMCIRVRHLHACQNKYILYIV